MTITRTFLSDPQRQRVNLALTQDFRPNLRDFFWPKGLKFVKFFIFGKSYLDLWIDPGTEADTALSESSIFGQTPCFVKILKCDACPLSRVTTCTIKNTGVSATLDLFWIALTLFCWKPMKVQMPNQFRAPSCKVSMRWGLTLSKWRPFGTPLFL